MRKRKADEPDRPKFQSCGHCYAGLVRVERSPGQFVMGQCACMLAFRSGGHLRAESPPPIDFKARATGESESEAA